MKNIKCAISLLFSVLLLTGCGKKVTDQSALKNVKATNSITWAVEGDKKLFSLIDIHDDREKGFDVDMAKAITRKILGVKGEAKFTLATSQSRIPLLKNGNVDAVIATLTITPERAKVISYSRPYFQAGKSFLVLKGSKIKKPSDLNGKTVIGIVGDNSVEEVKKVAPKAKVVAMQDYGQAVSALKSHQGDAVTSDNGILYGLAAQSEGSLEVCGGTYTKEPYGIAVNKNQGPFNKAINHAIEEIQRSGEYNRLIKKWFGQVPGFNYKEMYYK